MSKLANKLKRSNPVSQACNISRCHATQTVKLQLSILIREFVLIKTIFTSKIKLLVRKENIDT